MLNSAKVAELSAAVRGRIVHPGDADYDASRRVYNAMIDRHPGLIVYCRDVADVMHGVNFAREQSVRLAVRSGGHNAGGLGVCDEGVVLDLSAMNGTRVDVAARTVRVEGGCTWGDVDHATHAFGMATPCGIIGTTGVGGLTLGGGLGHLTRKCGLTVDNLLEADVVRVNGEVVTCNEKTEPDLFWAWGGGGNFGVVTSFERLHPIRDLRRPDSTRSTAALAPGAIIAKAPPLRRAVRLRLLAPPLPFLPAGVARRRWSQ
jgi:FAD/FMN-containing dehydrogenase